MIFHKPRSFKTKHISIDKEECIACWKCVETCSEDVICKRDHIINKYSYVKHENNCIGCFECSAICPMRAITKNSATY